MSSTKRITQLIVASALVVTILAVASGPTYALGATNLFGIGADAKGDACAGLALTGGSGCGDNGAQLNTAITSIVNILSAVVGIVAVIMIIVSGLRFMTANGDPSGISGAKRGLIYAIIGLVVVASSQVLVRFFLATAS